MTALDPISLFVWIVFYLVIIGLFYWCFRQSMVKLASQAVNNPNQFDDVERDLAAHHQRHRRHRHRHTSNGRHAERVIYTSGQGHNVYFITESGRNSNASSNADLGMQSPPEYKWEDLPPTYDEAVRSFTNPAFPEDDPAPGTSSSMDQPSATTLEVGVGPEGSVMNNNVADNLGVE